MVTITRLDATRYFNTRALHAPKKIVFVLTETGLGGKNLEIIVENETTKGSIEFSPVWDEYALAHPNYLFGANIESTGDVLGHDNTWQKSIDMP